MIFIKKNHWSDLFIKNRFLTKFALNFWPPLLGAGIKVDYIAPDYRKICASMPLRFYNRNVMKSHFGGSLCALTDPFYAIMLMHFLGSGYYVWDKSTLIEFVKPGRKRVRVTFHLKEKDTQAILEKTADGEKYFHPFFVRVYDSDGDLIACVKKLVYVRKRYH